VPDKVLGVIPARFQSSRFPGKALALLASKPIIQHVWERSQRAATLSDVIIATDDSRIYNEARGFGARVAMTSPAHLSGTDRVAEVAEAYPDATLIVNIQGDEPLIDPAAIDAAARALLGDTRLSMGTLSKRIERVDEITNPNVVKVVTALNGDAIYFSRNPIPYNRGGGAVYFKHIGLYVYRRDFLLAYPSLAVGPLEKIECLEQLRALENGHRIGVVETGYESLGVDTPEDLEEVSRMIAEMESPLPGREREGAVVGNP
jgi:3-deoxy-manno-octulosonate cytidylyltransferase (CMP-KDO synthetase)